MTQLVETLGNLSKEEFDSLDTTAWSRQSSDGAQDVWSSVCKALKMKSNDKNKKWLSNIGKSNIWSVADAVRQ